MKVVIIGLGSIAQKHITSLKTFDPFVEIVALRSSTTTKAITGVKNVYDWEAIQEEKPDFIIVSNPTHVHFNTLQHLKASRVPLFIEKPVFSQKGKKEKDLVSQISKLQTPTYVACNLRFLHAIQRIRVLINNERVNEVNVYCGSYLPEWRPNINYRTIYSTHKDWGGGVHLDLIHELDYVHWIFGKPIHTSAIFKNNSSLHIDAFDYANYVWEYENFCISIILNYYRPTPKRSIEIICESGVYAVDLLKNTIIFNNQVIFSSKQRIIDTYTDQLSFFINNILRSNIRFNSIEEGYNILELCLKE